MCISGDISVATSFSIIVSVLNSAYTIHRCINSVVKQSYPNKELIIIDGGSTDGTVEILQANDGVIDFWESKKDFGIYNAWNKALDYANGEWLYFLGADDYLFSLDTLESVAHELTKLPPECKLAYGRVCIVNKDGKIIFEKGEPWENFINRSSYSMVIPHQGVFHNRNLFEEYGRFDEYFQIAGDADFLFRILKNNEPHFFSGLTIAVTEYYGKSNDPKNKLMRLQEFLIARRNNGFSPVTFHLIIEYIWALLLGFLYKTIGRKGIRKIVEIYCNLTNQPPYWEKY